jgi:hypothetical protein
MHPVKRMKYYGCLGLLDDSTKGNASICNANESTNGNLRVGRVQLLYHQRQNWKSQKSTKFLHPEQFPGMKMEALMFVVII